MEKLIEINGRKYTRIKKYKYFTLFEDIHGIKTCFNDYDLGVITKISFPRIAKWESNSSV